MDNFTLKNEIMEKCIFINKCFKGKIQFTWSIERAHGRKIALYNKELRLLAPNCSSIKRADAQLQLIFDFSVGPTLHRQDFRVRRGSGIILALTLAMTLALWGS